MGEITVRATREVIDKPVRLPGQELVPMTLLRREPWFIISASIEFDVGGATEEEALQNLADTFVELAAAKKTIYLTRLQSHAGVTFEHGEEVVELPEGRDKAGNKSGSGDRSLEDDAAYPSPRHLTGYEGRTQAPSYARGGRPQGRRR